MNIFKSYAVCFTLIIWLVNCNISVKNNKDYSGYSVKKIVEGQNTNWNKYRGVVGVVFDVEKDGQIQSGLCSGTLIHPQVVLTAAHCIYTNEQYQAEENHDFRNLPGSIHIVAGSDLAEGGGLISNVTELQVHPSWAGTFNNYGEGTFVDVALLHLDTFVNFLPNYCINEMQIQQQTSGEIVGYGLAGLQDTYSAGIQRWGNVSVSPPWGSQNELNISGGAGACFMDSGGPVFINTENGSRPKVAGVVSHSTGQQPCETEGSLVANVSYVSDWIKQYVQSWTGDVVGGDNCTGESSEYTPEADCGDYNKECCGLGLCFDSSAICLPELDPYPSLCVPKCELGFCTTLEDHDMGACLPTLDHLEGICVGNEENPPQISCENESCIEGECIEAPEEGKYCMNNNCDYQGDCSVNQYCFPIGIKPDTSGNPVSIFGGCLSMYSDDNSLNQNSLNNNGNLNNSTDNNTNNSRNNSNNINDSNGSIYDYYNNGNSSINADKLNNDTNNDSNNKYDSPNLENNKGIPTTESAESCSCTTI